MRQFLEFIENYVNDRKRCGWSLSMVYLSLLDYVASVLRVCFNITNFVFVFFFCFHISFDVVFLIFLLLSYICQYNNIIKWEHMDNYDFMFYSIYSRWVNRYHFRCFCFCFFLLLLLSLVCCIRIRYSLIFLIVVWHFGFSFIGRAIDWFHFIYFLKRLFTLFIWRLMHEWIWMNVIAVLFAGLSREFLCFSLYVLQI